MSVKPLISIYIQLSDSMLFRNPPPDQPYLPDEVLRRILSWRLYRSPSFPGPPDVGSGTIREVAGKAATEAEERSAALTQLQRDAFELMLVCKAWKPIVLKYLYREPVLRDRLPQLASEVIRGESKWSDLQRNPVSMPGRFIQVLDLTALQGHKLGIEGGGLHYLHYGRIYDALFQLIPNLVHLRLPGGPVPLSLKTLRDAPFAATLKALEGLTLNQELVQGKDPLVWLLGTMPSLEVLSVFGGGSADEGDWDFETWREEFNLPNATGLDLPHLHTLTLDGVKNGLFLTTLINSDLPELKRLLITAYHLTRGDETFNFQLAHGHKIRSLTYLPHHEWPPVQIIPSAKTLEVHPNVLHLSSRLPNCLLSPAIITGAALASHPIQSLTVSRWSNREHSSQRTGGTGDRDPTSPKRLLATIVRCPPPHLKDITVDNFHWVRKGLGRAAMEAGVNGMMRIWATSLQVKGITLRDMDGEPTSCLPVGPGQRGLVDGLGVRFGAGGSVPRRRRSVDSEDEEGG